jgi:nitroreductase
MDVLEAISRRVSVRSFESEPADMSLLEEIRRSGEQAEALTDSDMQFHLLSNEEFGREIKGIIGDYGKINRGPHYILLVARECDGYMVDAGFRFEQLILEATRNNLGTCWVGGLFKESSIRSALGLDETSRVIALTPIGHAAAPGIGGRALRGVVRSSKRKPLSDIFYWQRRGGSLPESVLSSEKLMRVLEATRWAPSWANKQPWRFILNDRDILIYKEKRQNKEGKDYHLLDCGIAMAHLHLAAKALGMGGQWELGHFDVPGAPDAESVGRYLPHEAIG